VYDFKYRGNSLYCENTRLERIAKAVGTPFYCYSKNSFLSSFGELKKALSPIDPLICFSTKANSNLSILKLLKAQGAGLDVVSGGELFRAKKVGIPSSKIVFAGVGKTEAEIRYALGKKILLFNVESVPELVMIQRVAARMRVRTRVSLRLNVEVDPKTHSYIATGLAESKFGIDIRTARSLYLDRQTYSAIDLCGIHIHIGSQITTATPFVQAFKKVNKLIEELRIKGVVIRYLNIGGGLGIVYDRERPQTARVFAKHVLPLLKQSRAKIVMEPGRFISGNSGVFVTRVTYVKKTPKKNFLIVDGGMNDLLRPSLYNAYHNVQPLTHVQNGRRMRFDVVGPICESGDFLAKSRMLPQQREGDLLAIMGAGAYGFVMSSNYNSRPRPPEILVSGNRFFTIRRRESFQDLVRGETIPRGLQ